MSLATKTTDCRTCGHPSVSHEAGECWVDRTTGGETWEDAAGKCPCGWYEPRGA